ncbi:hypothetical protein DV738_g361, partial [Chaetothyriales sp. CBS 135597]
MAEQEDLSSLPFEERFVHKAWKVRKEAYEAAAKEFALSPDPSAPVFTPFHQSPELWKGAAADANVAAQVEGLAALCAFLKYGGPVAASRSRPHTIQAIADKALASTRPAAKQHAIEALLLYIENDKPDLVLDDLLPALSHKQPKVAAASIAALTTLYHNFGTRIVDPKPVLKQLPKAFGHADKNIRAEAQALAVELYRWHREAIKPQFWPELKPVQQTDLDKLFESVSQDPPQQQRFTRAQQAQQAAAAAQAEQDAAAGIATDGADAADHGDDGDDQQDNQDGAFDLAEPVDVTAQMAADFYDMVGSAKWKERKDSLDALLAVVDTPRIKDTPIDDLVRALAKCMKDTNVAVVTVAAHCIEKLALGLRKAFARHRSTVLEPMLERLKEKKQSVADALGAALDAVFLSSSMTDCLETTVGFLSHKNPNVRAETAKFLVRCLRTTREVPSKAEQKQIADAGTKLLPESTEQMRALGAEILGTLMKIIGERAMGVHLDGLDESRKNKINDYFASAQVKAKEKPKPVVAPVKGAAATSALGKKVVGGARKPATAAASKKSIETEEEAPKPVSRPLSKPGAVSKPGLAAPNGVKLAALKRPGLASPQPRKLATPLNQLSDDEAPLAELEELRADRDRMTALAENLKSTNTRLLADIAQLQNQNAQLIEDHTRDVLQIKAKETQLTRARGESDVLRSEMESLKKECERYKRELTRLGRESLGRERDDLGRSHQDDGFDAANASTSINGYSSAYGNTYTGSYTSSTYANPHANAYANGPVYDDIRPASGSRPLSGTALNRTSSTASAASTRSGLSAATKPLRPQAQSALATANLNLGPTEEKENHNTVDILASRRKISPPTNVGTGPPSTYSRDSSALSADPREASTSSAGKQENWKRAAEVTSQLKARIEAMKVNYSHVFAFAYHTN